MRKWWQHAFAVEPAGVPEPTAEEARLIDRLARSIVRRGLTTPALFFLDSSHCLNFLSSQALLFFEPLVRTVFRGTAYTTLARFLERRGSIEYLCRRIEDVLAEPPPPPETARASAPSDPPGDSQT